jgi:hypothetical protein
MSRRGLTDCQEAVLRQIADNAAERVTSARPRLARTVYALLDRGLVAVIRRGRSWTAELTEAGRRYLENDHQAGRPAPRRPKQVDRHAPRAEAPPESLTPDVVRDSQAREHAGFLWKPVVGATVTFEEWVQARTRVLEISRDRIWNPWRSAERKTEWQKATAVFVQWDRAEPGFRRMTQAQIDAWLADEDAKCKAEREAEDRRRKARVPLFDAKRHGQLQALLEQEAYLRNAVAERDRLTDSTSFPLMAAERRGDKVKEASRNVDRLQAVVDELREAVGDREAVVDAYGWLPQDRRKFSLTEFSWRTDCEIRRLRELVAELETKLAESDRHARQRLRDELTRENQQRELLEQIPPLEPADMCSECVHPKSWHEAPWPRLPGMGPCPAWPTWAAHREKVREELLKWRPANAKADKLPKPKPIAVIPSGLPIEEIMSKLAEAQAKHPRAIVRRGTANRWELWPPAPTTPAK